MTGGALASPDDEKIRIAGGITIMVDGGMVRIGIEAPKDTWILREELVPEDLKREEERRRG